MRKNEKSIFIFLQIQNSAIKGGEGEGGCVFKVSYFVGHPV